MPKPILVVGSSNTDMVSISEALPAPGETLMGSKFFSNPGGKGANQAVAARRLGGAVVFLAKVGDDWLGVQALAHYRAEGLQVSHVGVQAGVASGVALINVDAQGENAIVVVPGANAHLSPADIDAAEEALGQADYCLAQLETPLETIQHLAQRCQALGCHLVLNPAPAQPLPDELLAQVHLITPNETEASRLTGLSVADEASAARAAEALQARGPQVVIITLGSQGAYLHAGNIRQMVPAPVVQAVDSTAAGDTFNGALVVALNEGLALGQAVAFANHCAAQSVTREGAQASIPHRREIDFSPTQ